MRDNEQFIEGKIHQSGSSQMITGSLRSRRLRFHNKFDDYDDNGGPGRPQMISEYNAELEEGSAQIARGECMTSAELWEEMKKW